MAIEYRMMERPVGGWLGREPGRIGIILGDAAAIGGQEMDKNGEISLGWLVSDPLEQDGQGCARMKVVVEPKAGQSDSRTKTSFGGG